MSTATAAPPRAPPPGEAGLTSAEVEARRTRAGFNEVPEERTHPGRLLARELWGPIPWMLEVALALELALGHLPEALILAGLLVFNATLSVSQEQRARLAVELLRSRLKVMARARRDGRWQPLPARELVPDDAVHLRMGDIVPADCRVTVGSVEVDQSALTGESASVGRGPGETLYSGSILRRGEATAVVTATGPRSYFGRTTELVRSAGGRGHLQDLMFTVVRYLAVADAAFAALIVLDSLLGASSLLQVVPFILILLISSVPAALPATFTVANALESRHLAESGVLVTGLSAIEEAAGMEVLCTDKTGTLTQNRLAVEETASLGPRSPAEVLALAAAACDEATQDPIDLAILRAAEGLPRYARESVVPFDPATKRSEAVLVEAGAKIRVLLGQPAIVAQHANAPDGLTERVDELAAHGCRVLAVAAGPEGRPELIGLVALEDPVREDASALIARLREMGVRVVMVTGDTRPTAESVARTLGIAGPIGSRSELASASRGFGGFAGVYPEDKMDLVRSLQATGVVVGMTGDGVNDAPALKQAEVGVAVSNATDVAKAAAKVVLTRPGLGDIVSAVEGGRRVYRRMLTWMLNKISKNLELVVLLSVGFLVYHAFVTTPLLVLVMIFAGDFVTISVGTDRARVSREPDRWNVRRLLLLGASMAAGWLTLSFTLVALGLSVFHWSIGTLQTVVFLYLLFSGQATMYLLRERGPFWSSRPSRYLLLASSVDIAVLSTMGVLGLLMTPIPVAWVLALLAAIAGAAVALDRLKLWIFRRTGESSQAEAAPVGPPLAASRRAP